jgi:hypothetical protein
LTITFPLSTDTTTKISWPELLELKSDQILVINNYHGFIDKNVYKNQKVVIYTCFGEVLSDQNLVNTLEFFKNSFTIILTTRSYSSYIYEAKYNCKIISLPSAYALYSKEIPKISIDFENKKFNRHFLSLNNRAQWNRQALFQFILQFKLLDKFYFSYHCNDRFNIGTKPVYDQINKVIGTTWYNDQIDLESAFNMLPITAELDYFNHNDWSVGNPIYYNSSFSSFLSETYIGIGENYNVFFTEKIFKPLAFGHPFLVFSSAGALSKLKELGFETYSTIFDESYDDIVDPQQRFDFLLKQILHICNIPLDELQGMYDNVKPILKHNYEYFWNDWYKIYQIEMTQVIKQIKELIKENCR